MSIHTSFSSDWIGLAIPPSIVGPKYIILLFLSNTVLPLDMSYAYRTLAMRRLFNDPKDGANPVALTVLPEINSSTYACLPAHPVSAQEYIPKRQPFKRSTLDNLW